MPVPRSVLHAALSAILLGLLVSPPMAQAQGAVTPADSVIRLVVPTSERHYWSRFAAGAASSLLLHEAGHVGTALLLGARPSFGFDRGRPTVFSGINSRSDPRKQFLFSSMGLNLQALLDETILDAPHQRGSAFERGVLAAGVGTALFYVTIGRNASVSDIEFMSRTSSLSKADLTFIYGGVALLHAARIHRDGRYANFFLRPAPAGQEGLRLGVRVE
jgi:hypothetical protein